MDSEDLVVRFIGYDLLSTIASKVGDGVDNLTSKFEARAGSMGAAWQKAGAVMMATGTAMLGVGAGVAFGMYQAAKASAEFQSQIVLLHTHAAMLPSELGKVSDFTLRLASEVGFGPTALAKAFYLVQSASTSLPPQLQTLAAKEDILRQSARLAQIGHADLSDTVNVVTDVLDVYGKTLDPVTHKLYDASGAAGIMNMTVGEGKMRLQDIAVAFRNGLLPVANQAGLSLESLGAAMGTMADAGISTSSAAIYLRSALIQMIMPSGPAVDALKAIGVATSDAQNHVKGFSQVLLTAGVNQTEVAMKLQQTGSLGQTLTWLKGKMEAAGLSGQQAGALIARAFGGIRSGTGITTLSNLLDPLTNKERDAAKAASDFGSTWDFFTKHDPTFQMHQLDAALHTLVIVLGNAFLPLMVDLAQAALPIVVALGQWVSQHQKLVEVLAGGLATFLLVGGAINLIGGAVLWVAGGLLGPLAGAAKVAAGAVGLVGRASLGLEPLLIGVLWKARAAFGLLGPAANVAGGIIMKAGIAYFGFWRDLPMLMPKAGELLMKAGGAYFAFWRDIDKLGPRVLVSLRGLLGLGPALIGSVAGLGVAILPVLGIVALLAAAVAIGVIVFRQVQKAMAGFRIELQMTHSHLIALQTAFLVFGLPVPMAQKLIDIIKKVQEGVKTFQMVLKLTHDPILAVQAGLMALGVPAEIVVRVFNFLKTAIQGGVAVVRQFLSALAQNMGQIHGAQEALNALGQAWQVLMPILAVVIGIILSLLGGAFKGLLSALAVLIPAAIQVAIDIIQVFAGVIQIVASVVVGVVKIVNDIIHGNWSQAWKDAQEMVGNVAQGIGTILHGLVNLVVDLFTGLWRTVWALISGFVSGTIGAAQNLYNTLVGHSIIPDLVNGIIAWFRRLPGMVVDVLTGLVSTAASLASRIGTAIFNGIVAGLATLGGALKKSVTGAITSIPGGAAAAHTLGIPGYAKGGVVYGPTLAMVGEQGPELILPLSAISGGAAAVSGVPQVQSSGAGSGGSDPRMLDVLCRIADRLDAIHEQLVEGGQQGQGQSGAVMERPNTSSTGSGSLSDLSQLLYDLIQGHAQKRSQLGMRSAFGAF